MGRYCLCINCFSYFILQDELDIIEPYSLRVIQATILQVIHASAQQERYNASEEIAIQYKTVLRSKKATHSAGMKWPILFFRDSHRDFVAGERRHYRACKCRRDSRAGKTRENTALQYKLHSGAGKRRGSVASEFRMHSASRHVVQLEAHIA